jgi:predicted ATPase
MLDAIAEQKEPDIAEISFAIPFFAPDLAWLAPIRTKPKRTYDGYGKPFSPEGEHTPYLLRKQLNTKATAEKFQKALEAFGASSGLFRQVQIKQFGTDATSPFELHVVLGKRPLRINSVGYGVSQALPVVVELLSRRKGCWFAIQQPEVHLHPRAQAALGDVLFQLMVHEGKHFLIETHSDFTIDRFRKNYRDGKHERYSSQVLFFKRVNGGNRVIPLKISANGEYPQEQPKSFREFFLKEQMEILGL